MHCISIILPLSTLQSTPVLRNVSMKQCTRRVSCTFFRRQSVISGDSEFWKRAYLKEKQSSIASEVWHPFPCDAEPPSTSETTEDCNLSESIRQAVYWKRAAAASFTWRRFHSGPIMLIGLKVSHHRYDSHRIQSSIPPYILRQRCFMCSGRNSECVGVGSSNEQNNWK